jgi:type VI secretion system protein ImpA
MSEIDVEALLREVSPDAPCGADLEYDAAFLELNRAAAGKPAQEMGGQVIPGEEPDWGDVRNRCVQLFARTKDLRVGVLLARALLRTDGLGGLAGGLALLHGLVERHWEGVHPRLDPDDANDPTFRVNSLAGLADRDQTLLALRAMPLASSRRLGRFGLRDVEIASGAIARPEGVDSADSATIDAAFLDMDANELQASAQAAGVAIERLSALDAALAGHVGASASADFGPLRTTLRTIHQLLSQQQSRRGLGSAGMPAGEGASAPSPAGGASAMSGPVQSREDIIRVLDQCCDWYARNEPSSPVPLLLQRAKRLVSKNFLELVQDLSPSGVTEVTTIAGLDSAQ